MGIECVLSVVEHGGVCVETMVDGVRISELVVDYVDVSRGNTVLLWERNLLIGTVRADQVDDRRE